MSGPARPFLKPELPALARAVGSPGFDLARTPPLDDDPPFTVVGGDASIHGGFRRGVDRLLAGGIPLVQGLRAEGATPVSATLTPIGLERTLRLPGGTVIERMVVSSADSVCFLEWVAAGDLVLTLTWSLPSPGYRWTLLKRGLVVEGEGGRGLYALSTSPLELSVSDSDDTRSPLAGPRVLARLDLGAGHAVRLALGGVAPGADEGRLLRVMGRPQVVVPARRAESLRRMETGLSLDAPEAGLGEALEWAKVGLAMAAAAPGMGAAASERGLRIALAGLAVGETGPARRLLAVPDAPAEGPGEDGLRLVLASRYLAWTGDIAGLRADWPGVRESAERCLEHVGGIVTSVTTLESWSRAHCSRGLAELRVAAEEVGDEELAARIESAASGSSGPAAASRPRLEEAPAQPDASAGAVAERDEALRSAALVEALLLGILGVEPDAPRGRLTLRPRLASSWADFRLRNLRVGAAVVEMEYRRDGSIHRFVLRQVGGVAPIRVIFEPELGGARLERSWVDGQAAELDAALVDGRLRVPVQLVLDHERRLELEIGGAGH